METLSFNTAASMTLWSVVLVVAIITLFRRKLPSILLSLTVAIVLVLAFEAVTGYKLLDLGELWSLILGIGSRFIDWLIYSLLPGIQSAVQEIIINAKL